jgi:hypothetical protein
MAAFKEISRNVFVCVFSSGSGSLFLCFRRWGFWNVLGCSRSCCDVETRLYIATHFIFPFCFLSNLLSIVARWFSEINCQFLTPVVCSIRYVMNRSSVWIAEITHWYFRALWTYIIWVHITPLLKRLMSFALILYTWRIKFKAFFHSVICSFYVF